MVHDAVDFISTVDTPAPWELNIWYHTLNCGYRAQDQRRDRLPLHLRRARRPGPGLRQARRRQARLRPLVRGDQARPIYVSDGKSHLVDFRVDDVAVGESGSELKLASAGHREGHRAGRRAARPEAHGRGPSRSAPGRSTQKPYWDLERARIGETRKVPVEVIVNGQPVRADGDRRRRRRSRTSRSTSRSSRSSWVALRIYPVVAHQPRLRPRRRQADPGLEEVGRVVPQERSTSAGRRRRRPSGPPRRRPPGRRTTSPATRTSASSRRAKGIEAES